MAKKESKDKSLNKYETALACFVLNSWHVARPEYYYSGLKIHYRHTLEAIKDILSSGVFSASDPHQESTYVFNGTFSDDRHFAYQTCRVVSGSGNEYEFSSDNNNFNLSDAIKTVLSFSDTPLDVILSQRIESLEHYAKYFASSES